MLIEFDNPLDVIIPRNFPGFKFIHYGKYLLYGAMFLRQGCQTAGLQAGCIKRRPWPPQFLKVKKKSQYITWHDQVWHPCSKRFTTKLGNIISAPRTPQIFTLSGQIGMWTTYWGLYHKTAALWLIIIGNLMRLVPLYSPVVAQFTIFFSRLGKSSSKNGLAGRHPSRSVLANLFGTKCHHGSRWCLKPML